MTLHRFVFAAALLSSPLAAADGYYDGKTELLCTAYRLMQCDASVGCVAVTAQDIGATNQWRVNFAKRELRPSDPSSERVSTIDKVQYVDGTLYAQAIEDGTVMEKDGAAWSLSVSDPDGAMTIAIAANAVAFFGTGACVPVR